MFQSLLQFDCWLFVLINFHNSPAFDWVFWTITQLGNGWVVAPLLIGIICIKTPKNQLKKVLICGVLSMSVSGIINTQIKLLVKRPRPVCFFYNNSCNKPATEPVPKDIPRDELIDSSKVHVFGKVRLRNSFPSGHTNTAFSAATLLIYLYGGLFWISLLPAFLVAYSRVYLGVHFPLDTVVGAILGVVIVISILYACRVKREFPGVKYD